MDLFEAIWVAWIALTTHKMRALLTTLGIVIGVGSVVGMQAIGTGFEQWMAGEFNRMGVGVVYLSPGAASDDEETPVEPRLTAADAVALAQPGAAPAIARVAVEYTGSGVVNSGSERYIYTVHGVTPPFFVVNDHTLVAGRFFTEAEDAQQLRIALVGVKVAEQLYGSSAMAPGQRIVIDGVGFDIIGVVSTRPNQMGGGFSDPQNELFLPYTTVRNRLFRNQMTAQVDVSRITIQAANAEQAPVALRQATEILRARHRLTYQPNDFTAMSVEAMAEQSQLAMAGFTGFLVVIGGISLLIGGIGIMNIMLVSVTQRTREIGLRKAVGARQRDILLQFLIEAVVLCLIGAVLGIAVGYLLSFAGTYVMHTIFLAEGTNAVVTLRSILIATGVSAAIGLIFGLFPAIRAARLQPVKALRSE